MILAGDIGGTKCTLTLFAIAGENLGVVYRLRVPTAGVSSLESLLEEFERQARQAGHSFEGRLTSAGVGVAGAIVDDEACSSNLEWPVTRSALAAQLKLPLERTVLLNDLVAAAASLTHLRSDDLLQLNHSPAQAHAPKALIAAGTGLGEAILFWDGSRYRVSPSEAGLTDFAPRNERELSLLQTLRRRMPRVVTEEIVSGRGFELIHEIFFPDLRHEFLNGGMDNAAAKITEQALNGTCAACRETLAIWVEAYASEAGNMALRALPFGGVYVGGGIALKILPKLADGSFVRVFSDKAKLSAQLAKIPIFVVLNEDAPVLGAAYEAWRTAREKA
jgi:glucokinase